MTTHQRDDEEDGELWRHSRARTTRLEPTQPAKELLSRFEKLEALGLDPTAPDPGEDGRPVCRRCGKPALILHSLANEAVVVENGIVVVGVVRTTCGICIKSMSARETGQR